MPDRILRQYASIFFFAPLVRLRLDGHNFGLCWVWVFWWWVWCIWHSTEWYSPTSIECWWAQLSSRWVLEYEISIIPTSKMMITLLSSRTICCWLLCRDIIGIYGIPNKTITNRIDGWKNRFCGGMWLWSVCFFPDCDGWASRSLWLWLWGLSC